VVQGKSVLYHDMQGLLVRVIRALKVHIYFDRTWYLTEVEQVFHDGRRRMRELDSSVAEKFQPSESVGACFGRLCEEEPHPMPFMYMF